MLLVLQVSIYFMRDFHVWDRCHIQDFSWGWGGAYPRTLILDVMTVYVLKEKIARLNQWLIKMLMVLRGLAPGFRSISFSKFLGDFIRKLGILLCFGRSVNRVRFAGTRSCFDLQFPHVFFFAAHELPLFFLEAWSATWDIAGWLL